MPVRPRAPLPILAALAVALVALLAPSIAAAKPPLRINGTEDLPDATAGSGECEASTGKCTLRAAIETANLAGFAAMDFAPKLFIGDAASTIVLTAPLKATATVFIEGNPCTVSGASVPCARIDGTGVGAGPVLELRGDESEVENVAIESTRTAIEVVPKAPAKGAPPSSATRSASAAPNLARRSKPRGRLPARATTSPATRSTSSKDPTTASRSRTGPTRSSATTSKAAAATSPGWR